MEVKEEPISSQLSVFQQDKEDNKWSEFDRIPKSLEDFRLLSQTQIDLLSLNYPFLNVNGLIEQGCPFDLDW
jgi:hypothetical protein